MMPARKKSARKTGQDGAKANAAVEILSMALPPKNTLFLPNLRRVSNKSDLNTNAYCLDHV